MKIFNLKNKNSGYTILETMIAISIFLVIMMVGMGSMLNATLVQEKSEDMRGIMDNLSFALEDISRGLRAGYDYYCINQGATVNDCSNGEGISFTAYDGSNWIYLINGNGELMKSVNGGSSYVTLTLPEIEIDQNSGFKLVGSLPPPGDTRQPMVTMRIKGSITTLEGVITPFAVQTTVSQRLVDVDY